MLYTLKKGEYPEGHRYWSNATADLTAPDGREIGPEELPVQLRRVLDDLWSDGYGVECYLVEWDGRYCVQLSAMYDGSYAADLGMGYPELVELARGRAEELGAERPDLHVVFAEDGVPFCWDYQIKGFFKDACSALRRVPGTRSSKLTAFKKVIDGTVFVEQRRIPFQLPEGAECGRCERPLRASSASGERVALAASETVPAGTVLEFSILVMNPKDAETVREWLDYGALRGLFQWRNSGKGRFEWEEVAKED